jgi:superfamily II DNA or RNA helicase
MTKPELLVNRPGRERVADGINGFLAYLRENHVNPPDVAIATAYFNPGGYALLADELDHPGTVRILLGAEPLPAERRLRPLADGVSPRRAARRELEHALDGHLRDLELARDLLGFSFEADATARRLVAWLRSGRVEVRRLEDHFLHGKAFVVTSGHEGAIVGSSNFTYAGMATNLELNVGSYAPSAVQGVTVWFDEWWDQAVTFDLAALYESRFEPHPPYLVYLRMLFERYGAELDAERDAAGRPQIHLTQFQEDGLWRARKILAERNGVLIADEVGLGKTFLAGELLRETVIDRRQPALVVAPATLRNGPWKKFVTRNMLPVELCSFEDLTADRRLNPDGSSAAKLARAPKDYELVVIDESHNVRNPSTQRALALRTLLGGTPPKKVVLLTATPVNNSLMDLYYLLTYFLKSDAAFADAAIPSLRDHFARAMAMNPDDLTPELLFDVLDAIAVRRTRSFVKKYYPGDLVEIDGVRQPITFPTPRVLRVDYDLDGVLPGFFDRLAHALDGGLASDPTVLTFARYAPSRYRLDGSVEGYQVQLAGLIGSGLLKRFESSAYAFARTCRKMAASHDAFLALLDVGKVAVGEVLADWVATDSDDEDAVDAYLEHHVDHLDDASAYDIDALRADVQSDAELLRAFAEEAGAVTAEQDPKLAAVVEAVVAVAERAQKEGVGDDDVRDKRKVLVFSYFADTVDWIHDHLEHVTSSDARLADFRGRITSISGTGGNKDTVLWGFAPKTTDAPEGADDDRYDLVVTTDVLAEGVNLQQARHIINADLPWNPQRLVQRHGRLDRIGSRHKEIFLRCVFPDRQLDELLGLEERLHRKIKQAAAAVGTGEILPGSEVSDLTYTETREEIERLRDGDASLFEAGGRRRGALSGEEYRQELRQALENPQLAQRIKALPWGSGSGMVVTRPSWTGGPAFVFCVRIGDHAQPWFRYVDLGSVDAAGQTIVVGDTLACLDHARPADEFDTPRVLDDDTYRSAFDAWAIASDDIVASWNRLADPSNLQPTVPPAMRRAVEIVRLNGGGAGLSVEEADRICDALEAPYPERIVRTVRAAMGASEDPLEHVRQIVQVVREQGLHPSPAPEPLPEIADDDVHLVCWLAITAEADDGLDVLSDGSLPLDLPGQQRLGREAR